MTAVKPSTDNQEWNIKACTGICGKCEKPFEENQDFFTCLVLSTGEEGEEEVGAGFRRKDYCLACWNDELKQGAISSWKTFYKPPPPPKEEAVKNETAESILRSLLEKSQPEDANTIFVLAVMLERKRELIEKEVQKNDGGQRIRVYEHKESGDSFLVADPELKLDELEKVQLQVAELLGWNKGRLTAEPVELSEFMVCGANLRTRYKFEKDGKKARIPAFWEKQVEEKLDEKVPARLKDGVWHGVYHRYESDYRGAYTLTVGFPVGEIELDKVPDGMALLEIPAQTYLKFTLEGPLPQTLIESWPKIWKYFSKVKEWKRTYKADFEKYTAENTVEVYLSVVPVVVVEIPEE